MRPIPVLMYHHVNPHRGDLVTVTPETFEGQMRYLHEQSYRTLKVDELLAYIYGKLILKEKAVVVTFDDGWLDNYTCAFPVIRKYQINAAIFIVTDRTERASESAAKIPFFIPTHKESKLLITEGNEHKVVLNWNLIREMSDSGLVEFYSHTKSHMKCDRLPENELMEELRESKRVIEKKLGKPCPYLCWPYGKFNKLATSIAKDAGYKAIFTTDRGVVKTHSDPFAVSRIVIKDNIAWFKKRMLIYTNSSLSHFYLRIKNTKIF
jgi:peptidoglycan/xylan/chitin deacetylase (PgdA/CDA1 family)